MSCTAPAATILLTSQPSTPCAALGIEPKTERAAESRGHLNGTDRPWGIFGSIPAGPTTSVVPVAIVSPTSTGPVRPRSSGISQSRTHQSEPGLRYSSMPGSRFLSLCAAPPKVSALA
eukprot:3737808-Prymnesium_polylepis.3